MQPVPQWQPGRVTSLCGWALVVLLTVLFLGLPIFRNAETDLWYHLAGGRHCLNAGLAGDSSAFSFITPPRPGTNYYWLFQVVVYGVHRLASYPGLIALRALLFGGTLALCWSLLQGDAREHAVQHGLRLLLAVAAGLAVLPRCTLVRPHLFSYLAIAWVLVVLERRRAWAWTVPAAGVLWANLHGIEYPVLLLVLGAYAVDVWLDGRRASPRFADLTPGRRALLVATPLAVLATPAGTALLGVPFGAAPLQHLFISELQHTPLARWLSFQILPVRDLPSLCQNLVAWSAVGAGLWLAGERRARVSHLVLLLGGAVLLLRADRFRHEFVLLVLPLLSTAVGHLQPGAWSRSVRRAVLLGCGTLVVAALPAAWALTRSGRAYPFSEQDLPAGVVRFLNTVGAGGQLMNPAAAGGYYEWALDPRYRIYMDLQMSLFTADDYYAGAGFYRDPVVYRRFRTRYELDFVSAPLSLGPGPVAADPDFAAVFFDAAEVLFVNRRRQPEIAARYALRRIDPFGVDRIDYGGLDEAAVAELRSEAQRLLAIDGTNPPVRVLLANLCLRSGDVAGAIGHGQVVRGAYPGHAAAAQVVGTALYRQGHWRAAAAWLEQAGRSGGEAASGVRNALYLCYLELGQVRRANRLFLAQTSPFAGSASAAELYQAGLAARALGRDAEARSYLRMAEWRTTAGADPDFERRLQEALRQMGEVPAPPAAPAATRPTSVP